MKRLLCALLVYAAPAFALDGFYLGAQIGHVALTGALRGPFTNAIGFGLDLGVPTGSYLDVVAHLNYSSHGGAGGLKLFHPTLAAQFHAIRNADFDLSGEIGPGFYFFSAATTETKFGINFGVNGDVLVQEALRLGIGWRYHTVFNATTGDDFWTIMMRVGFNFQ